MLKTLCCGAALAAAVLLGPSPATAAKPITVPGFHGLRVPPGGRPAGAAPGGRGRIILYRYAMPRDALGKAAVALCKRDGWKIISNRRSPRGSWRVMLLRARKRIGLRVAGRGPSAMLILTR